MSSATLMGYLKLQNVNVYSVHDNDASERSLTIMGKKCTSGLSGLCCYVMSTSSGKLREVNPTHVYYNGSRTSKAQKIQARVQVSRPEVTKCHLQHWKHFGSPYCVVIVLDRNIVSNSVCPLVGGTIYDRLIQKKTVHPRYVDDTPIYMGEILAIKDEAPAFIINFCKLIQVRLKEAVSDASEH
ncbi:hypothetical protein Tco_0972544 [Tanacetum coccineum]